MLKFARERPFDACSATSPSSSKRGLHLIRRCADLQPAFGVGTGRHADASRGHKVVALRLMSGSAGRSWSARQRG